MKTIRFTILLMVSGFMFINLGMGQINDSTIAFRAYHSLKRANSVNGFSIGFGLASNIEMLAIGGFPMEVDDGLNPGLNITHMCLAVPRVATSICPPFGVSKARKILKPWRESPEYAASCKKLFSSLDAAQVLTAVAPVLCVSGGIMMFTASTYHGNYEEYNPNTGYYENHAIVGRQGLKTAGWICVGAGLAASISSAILISTAKKELSRKIGSFKMTAGPASVGLQYNLPSQH
jgi:hypothetical protein